MSKISQTYDAIITKLNALYPAKQRLFNPYSLEENPEICRKDGWGLGVGDATRDEEEFCNLTLTRSFRFVLMRHFVTLAGKEDGFDSVTKSLLEDQQSFLNAFYATDQIGQGNIIERIDIDSISGITELAADEKKYLFNEVNFTITLNELVE